MRQALYSGADEETVAARAALGRLLTDTGRPDDGARELRLVVQHARQLGGESTPILAYSLYHLAMALHHQGRMPEAADTFRKAAALYRLLPMEPTPESAESLLMLAGLESAHGRSSEVGSLYAEAIEVHRRLYGVDHPKYADALRDAANVTANLPGGLVRAEAQLVQAVQIYTRLRGPDQAGLANSLDRPRGRAQAAWQSRGRGAGALEGAGHEPSHRRTRDHGDRSPGGGGDSSCARPAHAGCAATQ